MLDRVPPAVSMAWSRILAARQPTNHLEPGDQGHRSGEHGSNDQEGSTTLGTTTADSTGAWSFTPVGLTDGVHILFATQTDLAGNNGVAGIGLILDRVPPAVSTALVSDTGSSQPQDHLEPGDQGHRSSRQGRDDPGGGHHARHDNGRQHGSLELHASRACRWHAHAVRFRRTSRQHRHGNAELHARYSRAIRGGLRAFP